MRTYAPSQSTLAPEIPLHLMGWSSQAKMVLKRLHMESVYAPREPLHNLGGMGSGAQIVGSSAPIAAAGAAAAVTALTTWGTAVAGPIGAAVGAVMGIIAGLWMKHDARVKGAKTENAAVSSAVQVVDGALHTIFDAANNGGLTAQQAQQQLQTLIQDYWSRVSSYHRGPGQADASNGGANCGAVKCDKSCTASCCVGCLDIMPSIQSAMAVFNSPTGGVAHIYKVFGDSYGLQTRNAYTLTFTPPSAAQGISGEVSSLFGGSGGSSMLPLLLVGVAAFLVLK